MSDRNKPQRRQEYGVVEKRYTYCATAGEAAMVKHHCRIANTSNSRGITELVCAGFKVLHPAAYEILESRGHVPTDKTSD